MLKIYIVSVLLLGSSLAQNGDGLDGLRAAIPGEPGVDYPIHSTNILCKLNPSNPGCPIRGNKRNQNKNRGQANRDARQSAQGRNRGSNPDFEAAVARGEIPGVPGQDYPTHSVHGLRKKGFNNLRIAPSELVVAGYPNLPQGSTLAELGIPPPPRRGRPPSGGARRPSVPSTPRRPSTPAPTQPPPPPPTRPTTPVTPRTVAAPLPITDNNVSSTQANAGQEHQGGNGQYCPGGSLDVCINFCPRDTYGQCVEECAVSCGE